MASRAWRITRKTLRWTLRIVLVLVLTVLSIAVLLLYSPGFLHTAINIGLGFYNDRIPGEIRIGRVEGRLADHLVLGDIFIADGDGRALVVARELTLDWSPWDLLDGAVTASSLTLSDAQVHLAAGGGFGDLAPPGPESPPRETIAPSLPIDLNIASVEISGVDLMADDGHTIVGGASLSARDLHWFGLVAHLELTGGAGQVPGVQIEALALTADFGEPNLQLHGSVTTDLGVVTIDRLDLDAARLDGDATIAFDGRREALMAKLPPAAAAKLSATDDPIVRVHARGTTGNLEVGVHAELPGLAALDVAVSGNPFGAPHLELRGRAEADLEELVPPPFGARLGVVKPNFEARLSGADWSQLAAELRLHCGDCGAASRLELHALATRDSVLSDLGAYVRLTGIGVDLAAELRAGAARAGGWPLEPARARHRRAARSGAAVRRPAAAGRQREQPRLVHGRPAALRGRGRGRQIPGLQGRRRQRAGRGARRAARAGAGAAGHGLGARRAAPGSALRGRRGERAARQERVDAGRRAAPGRDHGDRRDGLGVGQAPRQGRPRQPARARAAGRSAGDLARRARPAAARPPGAAAPRRPHRARGAPRRHPALRSRRGQRGDRRRRTPRPRRPQRPRGPHRPRPPRAAGRHHPEPARTGRRQRHRPRPPRRPRQRARAVADPRRPEAALSRRHPRRPRPRRGPRPRPRARLARRGRQPGR